MWFGLVLPTLVSAVALGPGLSAGSGALLVALGAGAAGIVLLRSARPAQAAVAMTALLALAAPGAAAAQELTQYREFSLDATVADIASATRVPAASFRTVHERPALLQEFEWRPSHYSQPEARTDSVEQITFSFHDGQLARMVVTYDSRRTAGMTGRDLISALTPVYGAPTAVNRAGENPDFGASAAVWNAADASVELFQGSDAWRLVLTSRARYASARRAATEAVRLDEKEAPARERARQKQEEAAERERLAQNRRDNTAAFQP